MIGTFTTPHGAKVTASYREDTSDWNTVSSCIQEDEYGLAERSWAGVAVDVGAHIGGATLALLADNPDLAVVAIEALPENADLLRENIERNGFADRAEVLAAAGSNQRGEVVVAYGTTKGRTAHHHRFIGGAIWQDTGPKGKRVSVPAVSLSDCVEANGPIALVKIDCEGCEWSFLDDPAVAEVAEIRGEYHPIAGNRPARLREMLEPTHDVTLDDTEIFGAFRAVRR